MLEEYEQCVKYNQLYIPRYSGYGLDGDSASHFPERSFFMKYLGAGTNLSSHWDTSQALVVVSMLTRSKC